MNPPSSLTLGPLVRRLEHPGPTVRQRQSTGPGPQGQGLGACPRLDRWSGPYRDHHSLGGPKRPLGEELKKGLGRASDDWSYPLVRPPNRRKQPMSAPEATLDVVAPEGPCMHWITSYTLTGRDEALAGRPQSRRGPRATHGRRGPGAASDPYYLGGQAPRSKPRRRTTLRQSSLQSISMRARASHLSHPSSP